jgi:PAS domain S-box-containing protein
MKNEQHTPQLTEQTATSAAITAGNPLQDGCIKSTASEASTDIVQGPSIQAIMELIPDPFFVLDKNLRFTLINQSAQVLIRKPLGEILREKIDDVIPKINETALYKEITGAIVDGNRMFRGFFKPFDIWIDCSITSLGNQIGIHFTDISETVMLERALSRSEDNYRHLINSIQEPFFALNKKLRITYWNETIEKITGIPAKNAVDKHISLILPQASGPVVEQLYALALATGNPQTFTMKIMAGKEILFETYVYPTAKGLSILCKDITERQKTDTELKQYSEHLERVVDERNKALKEAERLAAIGQTAGMVGHDIRNPLQSIISSLYLAKLEIEDVSEESKQGIAEQLELIQEQVLYINKIVTDLQDYAKRLTPFLEETQLEPLLQNVLSHVEVPKEIAIIYSIQKTLPPVTTDKTFVSRIITNLVTNAVQAMPNGGKLAVNTSYRDDKIVLTVEDTGEGISDQIKSRIFEPLFTTKSKGQGFGLAAVKRLVEALHGTIGFESEVGTGTKFIVQLPNLDKKRTSLTDFITERS